MNKTNLKREIIEKLTKLVETNELYLYDVLDYEVKEINHTSVTLRIMPENSTKPIYIKISVREVTA